MSTRERNIIRLAAAVALVFVLTRVLPFAQTLYAERAASIASVELDIARELRLLETAETWQQRRVETEAALATAETGLFTGTTAAIIAANIQRLLTQHAEAAGMTVSSTRLAEPIVAGEWTLISQEMSFRTQEAGNTVDFLTRLNETVPRLRVAGFNLGRSRNQFNGTITVVGFARTNAGSPQ